MRNYFVLDGVDSRDFGVYISGQGTFSAPARSYELLSVPGRNGDLVGTEKRFENGELTYPAFIYANFAQNIADFRAFLNSLFGYHRLVDSYHPNEYRMVFFQGEFDPDVTAKNDAASFDITFNAKPQRFLLSGEEVVTLDVNDPPSETFSGNPATFEADGEYPITDLTVDIEPVQDLHGYDNPWPSGGGKNIIDDTATADFSVELPAGTYYVKRFRIGSESTQINSRLSVNINGTDTYILPGTYDDGDLVATGDLGWGASPEQTIVTTKTYTFTLFLAVINGYRGKANIIMQTGSMPTAYSPYSNICPITGWDSVTVNRTGKNLCYKVLPYVGTLVGDGNKYLRILNAPGTSACFKCVEGETYIVSGATGRNRGLVAFFDSDPELDSQSVYPNTTAVTAFADGFSFTAEHTAYALCYLANTTLSDVNIQIELGSTATAYEPYNGNEYTIQLGETVYGGTVDVVNGKMVVDRAMVDLGTLGWLKSPSGDGKFYSTQATTPNYKGSTDATMVCSQYIFDGVGSAGRGYYGGNGTFRYYYEGTPPKELYVHDQSKDSMNADQFKTAMSGVQLCYELATPIVYDLTPTEVTLLLGTNNIWSDAGAVEGKYVLPFTIENPTRFNSQPLLRVYGAGNLGINGDTITISQADVYTDIDCEMMDAFKGTENRNQYITLTNYNFPVLVPGENGIALGAGITRVEITPRWWTV